MAESYNIEKTLIRANELIGELLALHGAIPGLAPANREAIRSALDEVRKVIAHSVALGIAKLNEK